MRAAPATSGLSAIIDRYLALKGALGRCYANERAVLRSLDAFLAPDAADLTPGTFARWSLTQRHLTATVRRNRMRIVRNLCLYRRRTEPACFVPELALFPARHQSVRPYIFTTAEIVRLLRAIRSLPLTSAAPLRRETFLLAIVLLYTAGLRRGELLGLTVGDYDAVERTLQIRASKFHKSRLLPLSADGAGAIVRVLRARRALGWPVGSDIPLLGHGVRGARGYTGVGLGRSVRSLLQALKIRTPDGRRPRIHDFRHTFALHALWRWYRAGVDVQTKLPLLATYMGHVSIASTAYYLPFIEPLAAAASRRFRQRCGMLVTALAVARGARR